MSDFKKTIQEKIKTLFFAGILSAITTFTGYVYFAHKKIQQLPLEEIKKECLSKSEKLEQRIKDVEEQIHGGDKVERGIKSVIRGLETKTSTLELLAQEEKESRTRNNDTIYKKLDKYSDKINENAKNISFLKGILRIKR